MLKDMDDVKKHNKFLDIIDGLLLEWNVKNDSSLYLDSKNCGFSAWQLFGYSCKHAIKVFNYIRKPTVDYVHHFLTQEYYLRIYGQE